MATKRTSKVLTVSLPPDDADDFERIATDEGRNRSELFREMLRVYDIYRETRTFESLQRYGAAQAGHAGIRSGGRRRAADPELARLRVVLDTNILISAFIFPGGPPEAVVRAALDGRVELVTSPPLLAELGRVLADKFGWEPPLAAEAVTQVARIATVVRPDDRVQVVLDDPDDDRVLEAAAAGRADVIVSGDRHLLRLRSWQGVPIEKAAAFVKRLDEPDIDERP